MSHRKPLHKKTPARHIGKRSLMALVSAAALTGTLTPQVAMADETTEETTTTESSNTSPNVEICKTAPYWVVDKDQQLYRSDGLRNTAPVSFEGNNLTIGLGNFDIAAEGNFIYGITHDGIIVKSNATTGESLPNVQPRYVDDAGEVLTKTKNGPKATTTGVFNALSIVGDELYLGSY